MGTGFKKREHSLNIYCAILQSLNTVSLIPLNKSNRYYFPPSFSLKRRKPRFREINGLTEITKPKMAELGFEFRSDFSAISITP